MHLNTQYQALKNLQETFEKVLTLGELIRHLKSMPSDEPVKKFVNPHSYRGNYCDLAIEPVRGKFTAGEFLSMLVNEALDKKFFGYKGGEYTMYGGVDVYIAHKGSCGDREEPIRLIDIVLDVD
jgi:hypothetical protein